MDKIEGLVNKRKQAVGRFNSDLENVKDSIHNINSKVPQKFNPYVTLVVTNPPSVNESDYDWATGLVYAFGGNQGMIMDTYRTPRRNGKNGIMKIEVRSVAKKVMLLKNKPYLRNVKGVERIFLRSFQSHIERLMDTNFRTIFSEIPHGKSYRITRNGRFVKHMGDDTQSAKKIPTPDYRRPQDAVTTASSNFSP